MSLDIGGRTAERVLQLIAHKGIAIHGSETGGFFACCLSLDLQTRQCRIEPSGIDGLGLQIQPQVPAAAEINQTIRHLKPIPQVAQKILRIVDFSGEARNPGVS